MVSATIDEAKERLRELIDAARAGEAVEITEDGVPVAVLRPSAERPEQASLDSPEWEANLDRLIREGKVVPPRGPKRFVPPVFEDGRASGVLDALLEERRTGR